MYFRNRPKLSPRFCFFAVGYGGSREVTHMCVRQGDDICSLFVEGKELCQIEVDHDTQISGNWNDDSWEVMIPYIPFSLLIDCML